MVAIEVRPLGWREGLVAFDVRRAADVPLLVAEDVRHRFVLWDERGRPHAPYPEFVFDRPMSGREVLSLQADLWAGHAQAVRRLFGAAPLAGTTPADVPLRGIIAFPLGPLAVRGEGRWTLVLRDGPLWHFSHEQVVGGASRFFVPSGEARATE